MLLDNIISVAATALITAGLSVLTYLWFVPKWEAREDAAYSTFSRTRWKKLLAVSSVVGSAVTLGGVIWLNIPIMGVIFGVMMFFLVFCACIDFMTHSVPREFTSLMLAVGALAMVIGVSSGMRTLYSDGTMLYLFKSFTLYMGAVTLMFVLMLFVRNFFGFADIKVWWAVGFFIAWWLGVLGMLMIAVVANLVLFVHMLVQKARARKHKNVGEKQQLSTAVLPSYMVGVPVGTCITIVMLMFG